MELENVAELVDERTPQELERSEAIASVPWDKLSQQQTLIVTEVLINRKSIEDIAREQRATIKSIRTQFEEVCEYLSDIHNSSENKLD